MLAEMVLMVKALPFLKSQKLNSVSLPNVFNFGFDYHLFIQVCLLAISAGTLFNNSCALAAHAVIHFKGCCSVTALLQQGT
jgi:hypothetical protein